MSKAPGSPPKKSAPIAYKDWNSSQVNWVELEKHLYGVVADPTVESPPPPLEDAGRDRKSVV